MLTHGRKIGTETKKRSEKWHRGKRDVKTNK